MVIAFASGTPMTIPTRKSIGQNMGNKKLEEDPMSADDVAKCDGLFSGMAQALPEHVLQSQTPQNHLEMI
ncbi:hypothetical protein E6O75_ATG03854 [Venturia nashicola]|uniref:Uncharacterized protein n=1 Tax=Venturia nashicola TaxID=86259 RepID=A0A4Z1PJN2_9PEZI|nr:hypothetical protein E6O75_ATG03854 [Venturia nashicola]